MFCRICLWFLLSANFGCSAKITHSEAYAQDESRNDKFRIKVFYETLCPASVTFFTSQLRPAIEKLAQYIDVQMIPYGHAKTHYYRSQYTFSCQHGPAECYGNQLHACVIDVVRNGTQAALVNACLMTNTRRRPHIGYDFRSALTQCGYEMNLKHLIVDAIRICVNGNWGPILLKNYGEVTHKLKLEYVPYLEVNGLPDEGRATQSLTQTICETVWPTPGECYTIN